jgi:hypothetical protein
METILGEPLSAGTSFQDAFIFAPEGELVLMPCNKPRLLASMVKYIPGKLTDIKLIIVILLFNAIVALKEESKRCNGP